MNARSLNLAVYVCRTGSSTALTTTQNQTWLARRPRRSIRITCAEKGSGNGDSMPQQQPSVAPSQSELVKSPEAVEIRFRRGLRRRQRAERTGEEARRAGAVTPSEANVSKKWEEMTVGEKAMELYMGEKGLLFWLNKFAHASIFIVIGGWILFRFVGPSLNLYQLDAPPLPPTSMFKGS